MDALPAIPADNLCVQATYYQTALSLSSCLKGAPVLTAGAEHCVLRKLRRMVAPDKLGRATPKEIKWCVQMMVKLPYHEEMITTALTVMEGSLDTVLNAPACNVGETYASICTLLGAGRRDQHPGVQAKGFSVLQSILTAAADPHLMAEEMATVHNMPAVGLDVMRASMDNAAVSRSAASFLNALFDVDTAHAELFADLNNSLVTLTTAVERYQASLFVAPELLQLAAAMARVPSVATKVVEVNALLRSLLSVHSALPTLPTTAMTHLLQIIEQDTDADVFFLQGPMVGVQPQPKREGAYLIYTLMRIIQDCTDEDTLVAALFLTHRLCANEGANGRALLDYKAIVSVMVCPRYSGGAAVAACAALCHLLPPDMRKLVCPHTVAATLGCLRTQLAATSGYPVAVVCALLCRVLHGSPRAQALCGAEGGVATLASVMVGMNSEPHVLMHAGAALLSLCDLQENAEELARVVLLEGEEPGRQFISRALCSLRLYYERHCLQALFWALFRTVCATSDACCDAIISKGAVVMYEQAVEDGSHARNVPLLCAAVGWARAALCREGATGHLTNSQGMEGLLDLTQRFGALEQHPPARPGGLSFVDVFAEATVCCLRLATIDGDARKNCERALTKSSVAGYRSPEPLRVVWVGHAIRTRDRACDEGRNNGTSCREWLEGWVDPTARGPEEFALICKELAKPYVVCDNTQLLTALGFFDET